MGRISNRTKIAKAADEHTRTVQAWLASRTPQGKRLHLSTVDASSTGLQIQFLNLALSRRLHPDITEDEINKEIENVQSFFAGQNVPWYWLFASDPAKPVGNYLEKHGMEYDPPDLPAMVAPLPAPKLEIDPAIRVWQANNRNDLMAASKIRHTAFGFPNGAGTTYFEDMQEDWLRNNNVRLYLASIEVNAPAAIGALIVGADLPGIYVMATLPECERKGLGRSILNRIVAEAEAMGYSHIVLTASSKGYPLYQKFGFEHVFDYIFYSIA